VKHGVVLVDDVDDGELLRGVGGAEKGDEDAVGPGEPVGLEAAYVDEIGKRFRRTQRTNEIVLDALSDEKGSHEIRIG
jgi:hypothetical protein